MQIKVRGFIMGKKGEQYADCRDNYAMDTGNHKFAIADGVSRSYFPGIWSELLVAQYVKHREQVSLDVIVSVCQQEWFRRVTDIVNQPEVKYYTKNAYNMRIPGLSTFVGLMLAESESKWRSFALGDTFLFFIPKNFSDFQTSLIVNSSKDLPYDFDNFPDYFSSIGTQHKGHVVIKEGEIEPGTFYLMTDALAEWFLKKGEDAIGIIPVWQDQSHFEKYIGQLRDSNEIANDDTSIMIIELNDDENTSFSYEAIIVSDLQDMIVNENNKNTSDNSSIVDS